MNTSTETLILPDIEEEILRVGKKQNDIIIHNDDVNTFQFVIETLVEVCDHNPLQAEQCALIIHHNGKCGVKRGDYKNLKPLCENLLERGLSAEII